MNIAILGAAGGIGQALSLLLKTRLPAGSRLHLYDVNPVVPGVAVDLSHIPTPVEVKGFAKDELAEALKGSDIVVIPAGVPRKPGMTRDDLFVINAGIIHDLTTAIAENCPEAYIGIITNPVNSIVPIAAKVLESKGVYNPKKLFGITTLDIIRSRTFIGSILGKDPSSVEIDVVGGHSGTTILPLVDAVEGLELSSDEREKLIKRVQTAGTEVVEAKAGGGSATLSMGQAGAECVLAFVEGLAGKTRRICAYVPTENEATKFFAKPIEISSDGVKELSYEAPAGVLDEIISILEQDIAKGEAFER